MNKILKILFAVEFILILAIIVLSLVNSGEIPTAYAVKEIQSENSTVEKAKFKVLTRAVCEEKSEHIFCHDELFIKCNGNEYLINNKYNITECNGIKLNLSDIEVNGSTIFKKEWADPRK